MSKIQLPGLHGSQHLPAGSDPIPGLAVAGPGSFPDAVAALSLTRDLRGYWRLGETTGPWADTSGYLGSGLYATGPHDAVLYPRQVALVPNVTGALPAADDDGAVQFNTSPGSFGAATDIVHAVATDPVYDFQAGDDDMTVTAWVKPGADASTFVGQAVGNEQNVGSGVNRGWVLGIKWPNIVPHFHRYKYPGSVFEEVEGTPLAADQWLFLAGVYSSATTTMSLYLNGTLVNSAAGTSGGMPTFSQGLWIGDNPSNSQFNGFYGAVDEVTVWGDALTADELATLGTAGTSATGTAPFDPATATRWWFPLVDSDGTCVLDASGALIPTLLPI